MKKTFFPFVLPIAGAIVVLCFYILPAKRTQKPGLIKNTIEYELEENEDQEYRAFFVKERLKREFDLLKDPATGDIPYGIREIETKIAKTLPVKSTRSGILSADNLNTYTPAGPTNIGGRTRVLQYDKRFNGTSNRVIIAGSISGGIFRSTDGGANWTRVNPENDIHNLSALAQDPRAGNENTWYAAGGEPIANSAGGFGAPYLGFGVWKSIDNGATWTKLTRQATDLDGTTILGGGTLEAFDNPFDFVHRITVNPANGHVYVCGHRRLVRSTDGGNSWNVVFSGTTSTSSDLGQMDLVATNAGKIYLAVNGGLQDQNRRGVWTSTDGTNWTRIAGGNSIGVDSVADWKGNSFDGSSKRIVMALAPSNQNILWVTYENGNDHSGSPARPEVDIFKLDATSGNSWTNLSANAPDFTGQMDGVDPFLTQGGYDLMIAVKPDDPNTVFLGGVNLFRSTNGFSTTAATAWIGGYGQDFPSGLTIYPNSHPDMHWLAFDPSDANKAISANDGGIQTTTNIMAPTVVWTMVPNYQTLQYYHVAMDPGSGRNNFIGGAQDNGSRFRDETGVLGAPTLNNHFRVVGGDGGATAIAKAGTNSQIVYCATQFGNIIRASLSTGGASGTSIRPSGLTTTPGLPGNFGDFVTYFKIDFDNTEDLYYVNFNRLFRTKTASTTSSTVGWEEVTGVSGAVNPGNPTGGTNISILALEMSRGDYFPSHALYIGTTNGRVFRFDNPRNALTNAAPVNITPPGLTGAISDIAVNPNNDEEIMVVVSNYNTNSIWWTNNAKSSSPTWFNAEGNLNTPSIRSCAIIVKKDGANNPVTEYYIGTSVGLYSAVNISTNLLNSQPVVWVREGANVLNFALITSMDYRPQDNILLIGTHGNGMYFASVGTPDFRPNQNTGIGDPVRNDKNFIKSALPTLVKNGRIDYQIGNMFTVRKLIVQIHSINGQQVYKNETGYLNGSIDIAKLSKGAYVLTITSNDYEQQFVQKFVKE